MWYIESSVIITLGTDYQAFRSVSTARSRTDKFQFGKRSDINSHKIYEPICGSQMNMSGVQQSSPQPVIIDDKHNSRQQKSPSLCHNEKVSRVHDGWQQVNKHLSHQAHVNVSLLCLDTPMTYSLVDEEKCQAATGAICSYSAVLEFSNCCRLLNDVSLMVLN